MTITGLKGTYMKDIACKIMLLCSLVSPHAAYAKPKVFKLVEQTLIGIAKSQLGELENQVEHLKKGLKFEEKFYEMEERYLKDLERNLSGHYNAGKLFNGAVDQAKRRWSNKSNNVEVQSLLDDHNHRYNFDIGQNVSRIDKLIFDQTNSAQATAHVASQYVGRNLDEHVDAVEGMMLEIDQTSNQKAATDLNSRIQAQVALEIIELKQLQAIQLESLSTMNQQYLNDKSQSAVFNGLKEQSDA